jgi:hypothetical protein
MANGDFGNVGSVESFLASLSDQPLAPEFDLESVLQAAQGQAKQQGEEGTLRGLQFGATRGLSGPQTGDILARQRSELQKSLTQAGLRAGLAQAEARRGDRLNRERLRFVGAQYLENLREARRARSLGLIQSLLSVGGTLGLGIPGLLAAGKTRKAIIGALGGLGALSNRGRAGGGLADSLSGFGAGAPVGLGQGFQGGGDLEALLASLFRQDYNLPSLQGAR